MQPVYESFVEASNQLELELVVIFPLIAGQRVGDTLFQVNLWIYNNILMNIVVIVIIVVVVVVVVAAYLHCFPCNRRDPNQQFLEVPH